MCVLRHTKAYRDHIEKARVFSRSSLRIKIRAAVKDQLVCALGKFRRRENLFIRASIRIGFQGPKMRTAIALDPVKFDFEISRWAPFGSVENVGCEISAH